MAKRFYGRCLAAAIMGVTLLLDLSLQPASADSSDTAVQISIRSSPTATYLLKEKWNDPSLAEALRAETPLESDEAPELSDIYVEWTEKGRRRTYRMGLSGNLYSEEEGTVISVPASSSARLLKEASRLSHAYYGELIGWQEASRLVPRLKVFTVVDLETGLSFRVQRRAGRDHADVQPVSKEDTRIMKRIYEDRWSWRRKAVLVRAEGRQLAASMNGMPHGGDGIPDNDFKGHFCIHFLDSSTHKSEVPDPAHRLMVYKASGRPRALLQRLSPPEQAESLAEAINQRDREWVRLFLERTGRKQSNRVLDRLPQVQSARIKTPERLSAGEEFLTFQEEMAIQIELSGGGKKRKPLRFEFARLSPAEPWRIVLLSGEI
ncbi:hypothetical protein [Cohnella thailandensis]|uniref:Copper amine oxidase-like N-terminal domain-containing protein n=1 Tax=Cohnella thailandensis TaxID=557557 RepID=A0A841T2F0_9BACL|nr:hypothetical protein [Cohnella thailandensis]MBB6637209.1 hypothetical protein [Cohnella thailandensis]MBP1976969.1 hypothetical protein [Cohnella thailandensis]